MTPGPENVWVKWEVTNIVGLLYGKYHRWLAYNNITGNEHVLPRCTCSSCSVIVLSENSTCYLIFDKTASYRVQRHCHEEYGLCYDVCIFRDLITSSFWCGEISSRYVRTWQVTIKHWIEAALIRKNLKSWWRHQMETFSALLALCSGNSPVTSEFPSQRAVTRSFGVLFYLRLNKRLSKQWRRRWFETSSRSLWRHGMNLAAAGVLVLRYREFTPLLEFHPKAT